MSFKSSIILSTLTFFWGLGCCILRLRRGKRRVVFGWKAFSDPKSRARVFCVRRRPVCRELQPSIVLIQLLTTRSPVTPRAAACQSFSHQSGIHSIIYRWKTASRHIIQLATNKLLDMLTQSNRPFTNNASGNLNKKQGESKYKLIDLDDFDVEMLNPHFLQLKTLKKPLNEHDISLCKTNPQGLTSYIHPLQYSPAKDSSAVIFQKAEPTPRQKPSQCLSRIDTSQLNIQPAYKAVLPQHSGFEPVRGSEVHFEKDKHTILAALMRKGLKPELAAKTMALSVGKEVGKRVGPAEAKLKSMMNKMAGMPMPAIQASLTREGKGKTSKMRSEPDEIGEEIGQEIDDYRNESFQKMSVGYESGIRESIFGESIAVKESVRESVRESLSGSAGHIKESIREDIRESLAGSNRSLKEEIAEEISGSQARSKGGSIKEVYEEIFQDFEASNSLSKSRGGFKKSQKLRDIEELSASKSFRMKTNVVKSSKMAEEPSQKDKDHVLPKSMDPKIGDQIHKEKNSLHSIQERISKWLEKKPDKLSSAKLEKNKDLYYNFKVELNRLIASDNFDSKLKKLVAFLSIGNDIAPDRKHLDDLEEGILKNVMVQVEGLRMGQRHLDEAERMKRGYEQKMKEQLLVQEVSLRAEMNQKLSEKDFELKKMIAELESRMMTRSFQPGSGRDSGLRAEQYEVESDCSINSSNVSWKADLWQLLPEFEKKKLYDKQSVQVTQFLADIMVSELREEALDRSADISFEFPEEYNHIPVSISQQPRQASAGPSFGETASFVKASPPNRDQEASRASSSDFLSDLPKLSVRKPSSSSEVSSEKEEEGKSERIRRDDRLKPEIIRILADYKPLYLKKKQEVIRNLCRLLLSKDSETQKYLYSSLSQLPILNEREFRKEDRIYVRAYEEELVMSLVGIYNRSLHHKPAKVEEEMRSMYDRLVVVSQVAIAEKCVERVALDAEMDMNYNVDSLTQQALRDMEQQPCVIEVPASENYMQLKTQREEKEVKDDLVKHVIDILTSQFAREFPGKRK